MSFRLEGIDHVEVFVRDLDAAARWYADALGLKEVARWDPEPIMIGAGASKLALFQSKPNPPGPTPDDEDAVDWHRVAWRTDEAGFAAAQARLKKLGVAFHGPVDHGIAESIYFRDPDGHRLEITWYRNSKSS